MARMVRKQVYLRPRQDTFLKRRAGELGVSEADLIRQAIDLITYAEAGGNLDAHAWADEQAFLEQRARARPSSNAPSPFRRDDIYRERLGQVPG